jgi:hypothetical protein
MKDIDEVKEHFCSFPSPFYFSIHGYSEKEEELVLDAFEKLQDQEFPEAGKFFEMILDRSDDEFGRISSRMNIANCGTLSKEGRQKARTEYVSIVEDLKKMKDKRAEYLFVSIMENLSILNMMDMWDPEKISFPEKLSEDFLDEVDDDLRKASHLLVMGKISLHLYYHDRKYEGSEDEMGFDLVEDENYLVQAKEYIERALGAFSELQHQGGLLEANIEMAKITIGEEGFETYSRVAQKIAERTENKNSRIHHLIKIAQLHRNLNRPRGEALLDDALDLSMEVGSSPLISTIMMDKAMLIHNDEDRYEEAMELANEAYKMVEKEGDPEKIKSCRNLINIIRLVSGKSNDPLDLIRNIFQDIPIQNFPPKDDRSAGIMKKLGKKLKEDLEKEKKDERSI